MPTPDPSRLPLKALLRGLALSGLTLAGLFASAAEPADAEASRMASERAGIQAERERLEAQFAAELARCVDRFAVTACQDDVRERRRAALEGPRARALALDDAERLRRAAARREALAQKQRLAAERPPAASAAPVPPVPTPVPAQDPSQSPPRAPIAAASAAAEAAAAQRAAAARRRQASIQAEQARVEARQAERARQGKQAAPLPVPAASRAGSR